MLQYRDGEQKGEVCLNTAETLHSSNIQNRKAGEQTDEQKIQKETVKRRVEDKEVRFTDTLAKTNRTRAG